MVLKRCSSERGERLYALLGRKGRAAKNSVLTRRARELAAEDTSKLQQISVAQRQAGTVPSLRRRLQRR